MADSISTTPPFHPDQSADEDPVELLLALSEGAGGDLAQGLRNDLALVSRFFGLEFGIVSRVEGDTYVVEQVHQPEGAGLEVGQRFELGTTYCAITLEASDVVAISEMGASGYAGHPCYSAFGLEAYIGVPLRVEGELHGTLNFSSPAPRSAPWTDNDRQLVRMLARWIEGSIAADRQRRRLNDALRDLGAANRALTSRNEDLDQFARHASHDLKAPLKNVVSLVELLREDLGEELPPRASEDMDLLEREVQRMTGIVSSLLEFARAGRGAVPEVEVALEECVSEALAALRQMIEGSGAEISVEPLPATRGSRDLLTQAFQNLLGNALKFRREGAAPRISVRARRDGDLVHVDVTDDGIGLDPRHAEAIFAPLTRLHGSARYEGHGLGLAIVRKIAGQHGGSVAVASTPGEGSTFTLTLPSA